MGWIATAAPRPRDDGHGLLYRHYEERSDEVIQRKPMKQPAVHIMANKRNGTLYTGVTSNLPKRAHELKAGITAGFSSRYGCAMLVCFKIPMTWKQPSCAKNRSKRDPGEEN